MAAKRLYTLEEENTQFAYSFLPGVLFVSLLCLISLLSYLTGADLSWLGVRPRSFFGLIGVITSPLIHGDLLHLLSNAFPLVLLSGSILFLHRKVAVRVILLVYVLSGILTWFIGRPSFHIGASGVVYGLAGFLLFNGFLRQNRGAMAVSLIVLFLYSGLFYGLLPTEERISWEGHIAGFAAGLVAALVYSEGVTGGKTTPTYIEPNIVQRHVSNTMGPHYRHLHINYQVQEPARDKSHLYTLDTATGKASALTNPAQDSFYTKNDQVKCDMSNSKQQNNKGGTVRREKSYDQTIEDTSTGKQSKWPLIITLLLIAGLVASYFLLPGFQKEVDNGWDILTSGDKQRISEWVSQFGFWGPFFIILAMVAQMFLLVINVVALMLVAIIAYGSLWGTLIAIAAVLVASTIGYLLGRGIGEAGVSKIIGNKTERKVMAFVQDYGLWAVIIARVSPFLSNDAISIVAGLAKMNYFRFIGATLAGITPLAVLLAWLGENNDRLKTGLIWVSVISLAAFIGYIVYDKYIKK